MVDESGLFAFILWPSLYNNMADRTKKRNVSLDVFSGKPDPNTAHFIWILVVVALVIRIVSR